MSRRRISDEPRVATAVRFPESVHLRLHEAAVERGVSANLLVTMAVTQFLDHLPSASAALAPNEPAVVPTARRKKAASS